jgi:class 3 adenylate cyclase/predicted ATPase
MEFAEILTQVIELLQRQGRISYGALKRRFHLDDEYLQDLKDELIDAQRVAVDEDGKVLVWVGASAVQSSECKVPSSTQPPAPNTQRSEAERRQLTVLFCDLVGSTALSEQLDLEELREIVQAYQQTCAEVIHRYEGHIAQYLGDGVLVYFGYPVAHEDDAARAVRAGLEIVAALQKLVPSPFQGEGQGEGSVQISLSHPPHPSPRPFGAREIQVRIGIHTGLVVVGEMGGGEKREQLALGETPNIAARLQGLAEPDTVVISAATHRLTQGLFGCQDLGPHTLKGITTPLSVYRVAGEGGVHSRFEAAISKGLTPLVGRDLEMRLLRERWAQAKEGAGQVVLLNGEPGIGKSRLVQTLKEQIMAEGATRIEFHCSPYHQNSAFYPIIEHLQRLLQFEREDSPQAKFTKLQQTLAAYRFPQADTLPLLASLLSLPHPEDAPPLTLSPQKQKQKTQEALVAWVVEEAEKAPVFCAWEDLHWADPSTVELLHLLIAQAPTSRLLTVLTFRPEFTPPWGAHSYLSQLTLSRLGRSQVKAMVEQVAGGKAFPAEVLQQIVAKTDGVPLFVEELTKMVIESEVDVGARHAVPLPLGIPATLHDALMARLDRLNTAKEIAQLGATVGREFSYELLHAVASLEEESLQQGLRQLVDTELVYQRGVPPHATYIFKHALVQDAAYQSLLKSRRQQYHSQIAHALEERFPDTKETQPELLAHHYTEAGLIVQALPYWQQAGEKSIERSANLEAISDLTKGLDLLKTLPDTPEQAQQELNLQIALGAPLMATKGFAAPEVEKAYARARELCQQVGETPQLFRVLSGLWFFHLARAELQTALELAEQLLSLAQNVQDPAFVVEAHRALGMTLWHLGEFAAAQKHCEQGIALYDAEAIREAAQKLDLYVLNPWMFCWGFVALSLWLLGYPDQALKRAHEALTLTREWSHSFSSAMALNIAAWIHQFRQEEQATQEVTEAEIVFCNEQGFTLVSAEGTMLQGWALVEQGKEEGLVQIRQGLATWSATGAEMSLLYFLILLAEAYRKAGQAEEGLSTLSEALTLVNRTGERFYEAELYRLRGELTLQQSKVESHKSKVEEAEGYFLNAIKIAQHQQTKSLELRAIVSLARLWQQQGKQHAARTMLSDIYNWFTEGFDTKDLQEAKALLDELG